jgi:hypothetical protein
VASVRDLCKSSVDIHDLRIICMRGKYYSVAMQRTGEGVGGDLRVFHILMEGVIKKTVCYIL